MNDVSAATTSENEDKKTISIGVSTYRRIKKIGNYGDSFDSILRRVLTVYDLRTAAQESEGSF
jgi:hypothetical protein